MLSWRIDFQIKGVPTMQNQQISHYAVLILMAASDPFLYFRFLHYVTIHKKYVKHSSNNFKNINTYILFMLI